MKTSCSSHRPCWTLPLSPPLLPLSLTAGGGTRAPHCFSSAASWALAPVPVACSPRVPMAPSTLSRSLLRSPPCCFPSHLIKLTPAKLLAALSGFIFLPRIHHQLVLRFICALMVHRVSPARVAAPPGQGLSVWFTAVSPSLMGWMDELYWTEYVLARAPSHPGWAGRSDGICGQWEHKSHFETG